MQSQDEYPYNFLYAAIHYDGDRLPKDIIPTIDYVLGLIGRRHRDFIVDKYRDHMPPADLMRHHMLKSLDEVPKLTLAILHKIDENPEYRIILRFGMRRYIKMKMKEAVYNCVIHESYGFPQEISVLNLSKASYNKLMNKGVTTIDQILVLYDPANQPRNFKTGNRLKNYYLGKKQYEEVIAALKAYGISLDEFDLCSYAKEAEEDD